MPAIQNTIKRSPRQPGYIWINGVYLSVPQRQTCVTVSYGLVGLSIANEQFKSYASDLVMT